MSSEEKKDGAIDVTDEKQSDAHIGETGPEVRGRGPARGGDDRDDARPHGIVEVDTVEDREDRHQENAAAEPEDGAHRAGSDGSEENREKKGGELHVGLL